MPIDETLLRSATEARQQAEELQREAARARFTFHQAVCDLHRAGGSLREIAEALDLSHQRVHQIVEAGQSGAPRSPWSRILHRRAARQAAAGAISVSCSFCGRDQHTVHRLIAGPGTYICDTCVALARRVLDAGAAQTDEHTTVEPAAAEARCHFCGKGARHHQGQVVAHGEHRICANCVRLCEEIARS